MLKGRIAIFISTVGGENGVYTAKCLYTEIYKLSFSCDLN